MRRLTDGPVGYLGAMSEHPEERDDEVGAANAGSEDMDAGPGPPADDDAPLGDTDQHSEAQDA